MIRRNAAKLLLVNQRMAPKSPLDLPLEEDTVDFLDKWRLTTLRDSVREKKYLTRDEYRRLLRFKLLRGKWRPRLENFATALTEAEVKEATKLGLAELPNLESSMKTVTTLKGCGPAFASYILNAYDEKYPLMSDELLASIGGWDGKYTVKSYQKCVDYINGDEEIEHEIYHSARKSKKRKIK